MNTEVLSKIKQLQKNEVTEHIIYSRLSKRTKSRHNKRILEEMASDELRHYKFWKSITKREMPANMLRVYFYLLLSRIFGLLFGLKLMERGEKLTAQTYKKLGKKIRQNLGLIKDEHRHEKRLLNLLKEERVEYAGSVVLGLNDALVELTGALVGLTFALQNGILVAVTGFITGFAASLSMAASSFLASREETGNNEAKSPKSPLKSAVYTGISYIITVIFLILPYIIFKNVYIAMIVLLVVAILIIAGYTFYISKAKNLKFWRRFLEMAIISLGVAVISFGVGWLIRTFLEIEV